MFPWQLMTIFELLNNSVAISSPLSPSRTTYLNWIMFKWTLCGVIICVTTKLIMLCIVRKLVGKSGLVGTLHCVRRDMLICLVCFAKICSYCAARSVALDLWSE